jgi:glycerophosphoryl diester phosphodiesterase
MANHLWDNDSWPILQTSELRGLAMPFIDPSPERRTLSRNMAATPVWISHRGVREEGLTENTLGAFERAVTKGYQWLETDLRLTKDGHIVLCHDDSLDRITGRVPSSTPSPRLIDLSREEVGAIELPCRGGVLFLDQFMERFRDLKWVFDIKQPTSRECILKLRSMIDQMPDPKAVESKITFVLWSRADEEYAKQLFRASSCFAQPGECRRAGICCLLGLGFLGGIVPNRAYSLTPKFWIFDLFTRRIFKSYQDRGAKTILYLPETKADLERGLKSGANFILSDELICGTPEVPL